MLRIKVKQLPSEAILELSIDPSLTIRDLKVKLGLMTETRPIKLVYRAKMLNNEDIISNHSKTVFKFSSYRVRLDCALVTAGSTCALGPKDFSGDA